MRHVQRAHSTTLCKAALVIALLMLVGCSSPQERAKGYYEHGLQLLAAHDNKRAEIEFRNAVQYDRKLLPAWQSLAKVEELTHNWGALVGALRGVVDLDPNDMASRVKLARLLLLAGNVDEALRIVNAATPPNDQNSDLLALKATILFKLNDTAGAAREAHAALKVDPNNAGALFVLAGDRFARGDAQGALQILNSPAMASKSDVGVDLFKLRIFEKTQDLRQAETLLHRLIELYPKQIGFKRELIRLYLVQHRNDDAEKQQRAIIAADPNNVRDQLDLVRLLNTTKGAAAARAQLDTLIKAGGNVFPYQVALAQFEFAQGELPQSAALLKSLIADPKNSADQVRTAQLALAEIYVNKNQLNDADAIVSDILNKDARNTNGLKLRAAIRMQRGQLESAISDLRQALNDQPQAVDLMQMLAVAYERSGSIDLAETEYSEAMRVSNFNPPIGLSYVAFLRRRGSLARAEDVLTALATRWPKDVNVLTALGQVRLARQEWPGAQEVAETIKRLGTNAPVADELLGAALAGGNKFNDSITAFQNAYDAAPTAVQPMYALVRAYLAAQKPDQAIAFLQSVLKASPANAEAYVLLGSVQLAEKQPLQAQQSFMMAIQKQPKDAVGYRALTNFYILQKDYDAALKTTNDGLKEQPSSAGLHLALADVLERKGDYEGAITQYENLIKQDPGSIIVANDLASLLSDHRTDKASLDHAKELAASLQKSPVPQFKDTLGWADYRQGDYQAALALIQAAALALPNVALIRYHLGMTYAAVGQTGNAAKEFDAAMSHAPEPDLAAKIRAAQAKVGTE
jgi:tetratricopeptide (TPR) repeat protein